MPAASNIPPATEPTAIGFIPELLSAGLFVFIIEADEVFVCETVVVGDSVSDTYDVKAFDDRTFVSETADVTEISNVVFVSVETVAVLTVVCRSCLCTLESSVGFTSTIFSSSSGMKGRISSDSALFSPSST